MRPGSGPPRDPTEVAPWRVAGAWTAVAGWTGVVWWLGSSTLDASSTSRFLEPLLRWLWPDPSPEVLFAVVFALRKLAHLGEYGLLAALAFHATRLSGVTALGHAAAVAGAIAVGVAALDETRQALLPTRTGSSLDVALDAAGAAVALAALAWWLRRGRTPPLEGASGV